MRFGEWCNQCSGAAINGYNCHEAGCPNEGKRRDESGQWIRQVKCYACGDIHDEGEPCCVDDMEDFANTEEEEL